MRIQLSIRHEPSLDAGDPSRDAGVVVSVEHSEIGEAVEAETLARLVAALTPPAEKSGYRERIIVKNGGRLILVRTRDVDWIEAEGNYVLIHVGRETHIVRETVGNLESQLDPTMFRRIHRSAIVNVDRIRELRPTTHGDVRMTLDTGAELMMSRGYRDGLLRLLGEVV